MICLSGALLLPFLEPFLYCDLSTYSTLFQKQGRGKIRTLMLWQRYIRPRPLTSDVNNSRCQILRYLDTGSID